jgi:DNA-binding ferritin-like protein
MAAKCEQKLQHVLASLRAVHWNAWTSHWQARGATFFSDHGMFEKIYTSVEEDIDGLAEKMVSFYGEQSVDAKPSMELAYGMLEMCSGEKDPFKRALMMEQHLQVCLEHAYEELEQSDNMTLGLDNFLQGVGDKHERWIYFLGQRTKG